MIDAPRATKNGLRWRGRKRGRPHVTWKKAFSLINSDENATENEVVDRRNRVKILQG